MPAHSKISNLDILKVLLATSSIPAAKWAKKLDVDVKTIKRIRTRRAHPDVTIESLPEAEQSSLWQFLKDLCRFTCVYGKGKANVDAAFDQSIDKFLAGHQFQTNDDLLSLPAAAPVAAEPPSPQPEHKAVAQNKSVTAEFLPVSDEAYHADDDGYEVVDDSFFDDPDDPENPDSPWNVVDDSADALKTPAPTMHTVADLKQAAVHMNAANPPVA